eukprot:COSAG05_NODE_438_length_9828_cov_4.712201_8_plen_71_part_00
MLLLWGCVWRRQVVAGEDISIASERVSDMEMHRAKRQVRPTTENYQVRSCIFSVPYVPNKQLNRQLQTRK